MVRKDFSLTASTRSGPIEIIRTLPNMGTTVSGELSNTVKQITFVLEGSVSRVLEGSVSRFSDHFIIDGVDDEEKAKIVSSVIFQDRRVDRLWLKSVFSEIHPLEYLIAKRCIERFIADGYLGKLHFSFGNLRGENQTSAGWMDLDLSSQSIRVEYSETYEKEFTNLIAACELNAYYLWNRTTH